MRECTWSTGRTYRMNAVKALVRHIIVVHTSNRAAHQDPSTVIFMGAACAGACGGISSPVYVASVTCVGSQRALQCWVRCHQAPANGSRMQSALRSHTPSCWPVRILRNLPGIRENDRPARCFQAHQKAPINNTRTFS